MVETAWRDFYSVSILELDRSLLKVRLKAAEDAINARASDARASREERREMAGALSTLHRLKRVDRRLVPNRVETHQNYTERVRSQFHYFVTAVILISVTRLVPHFTADPKDSRATTP